MEKHKSDKANGLSSEQRALLLKKIRARKKNEITTPSAISRKPEGSPTVASYAQERMWFLDYFIDNKRAYNISRVYRVKGKISEPMLEKSVEAVVKRHDIFRTVYWEKDGKIMVCPHNNKSYLFSAIGLYEYGEIEKEKQWKRIALKEAEQQFDLQKGPLLRIFLIHLTDDSHVLVITMHHIISDGWSVNLFLQELADAYDRLSTNRRGEREPLLLQYADYVYHSRITESDENEKRLLKLKEMLSGHDFNMDLSFGKQRPITQSYQGDILRFSLDKILSQKLRELAKSEHITLFMLLYSIYHLLLVRYTGTEDLIIGIPVANREERGVQEVIGLFVNTLPIRFCHEPEETVRDMLSRLKDTVLESFSCRHVPFDRLIDALELERDLRIPPLCQAMFALQNTPAPVIQIRDIRFEPVMLHNRSAKLDLTLELYEDGEELYGWFEYNTDILNREMVEQMKESFLVLAGEMIKKPEVAVKNLNILSESQKAMLDSYNSTEKDYGQLLCLHEYFQMQAERTPENTAVIFQRQKVSYTELNERANRLACYLREKGTAPEKIVGICMERSVELVVGLLGILKAGGAYVPIDPEYPQERISYMINDSGVDIILTQQSLREKLVGYQGESIIMDVEADLYAGYPSKNLQTVNRTDHMAYVIYTSGTTGKPKGVVNQHDGIVNRLLWMQDAYGLVDSDRVLQKTPYSFDVSVWEFFWPLMTGAALVLAIPQGHKDADYLAGLIQDEQITTIHFVPSMLKVFLESVNPGSCASLKRIICSGEALSYSVKEHCNAVFEARLYNLYGPTEAAVDVTSWNCRQERKDKIVPIGKPISNIKLYITDEQMRRVPPGVIGQLCISGVGVARGYWNKEKLTDEKFVEVSFSEGKKVRLYKTGDLARYLPDGMIEYIGRTDHQVKVRGFRIELAEIESVLNQIPEIHQSIVVAKQYQGNSRLVAYLVKEEHAVIDEKQIRNYLWKYLPDYMIPSFIIFISQVPLSHNGKLDLNHLPEPVIAAETEREEFLAPQTRKEKILADIWIDILHLDSISVNDNFFEVGGDSLLAIQVVSRAQKEGLVLTIKQVFELKTLERLAAAAWENTITGEEMEEGEMMLLTPIQSWFFAQEFEVKDYYNQSLLLRLPDKVDTNYLKQAIRMVFLRHEALRLFFRKDGDAWVQQLMPESELDIVLKKVNLQAAKDKEKRLIDETRNANLCIDVESGKLAVCLYVEWGSEEKLLFLSIHHLAVDAVSWQIIVDDLNFVYSRLEQGQEVIFPPRPTSFYQWVKKLEEYAKSEEVAREIPYWRKQLSGQNVHITQYSTVQSLRDSIGSQQSCVLCMDAMMTELLLNQIPVRNKVQPQHVLMSALLMALGRLQGTGQIQVDMESHGREDLGGSINISGTVGWFTALYTLAFPLFEEADTYEDVLYIVKDIMESVPGNGIGFGLLKYLRSEELPELSVDENVVEIQFNYLGKVLAGVLHSDSFSFSDHETAPMRAGENKKVYPLEVNSVVLNGICNIEWLYSPVAFTEEYIKRLIHQFECCLHELIRYLSDHSNRVIYTSSDFPLAELPHHMLNMLSDSRAEVETISLLTSMQSKILAHNLMDRKNCVQHLVCGLTGELNEYWMKQSWQDVMDRHEVLRSGIQWRKIKEPLQIIYRNVKANVVLIEKMEDIAFNCAQDVLIFMQDNLPNRFAVEQAPLWKVTIIKESREKSWLIFSYYNSLFDNWSCSVIFDELFSRYEAYLRGEKIQSAAKACFSSYLGWIRRKGMEAEKEFWSKELSTIPEVDYLPINRLGKAGQQDFKPDSVIRILEWSDTNSLQVFAGRHSLTLNTLIQGAWARVLMALTEKDSVLFGILSSGRTAGIQEIDNMVGVFVNILPVVVSDKKELSTLEWLRRLQEKLLQISEFEYLTAEQIAAYSALSLADFEIISMERTSVYVTSPSKNIFSEEKNKDTSLFLSEFYNTQRLNVPLRLYVTPAKNLSLEFKFNSVCYEKQDIERLMDELHTQLQKLMKDN